MQQRLALYQGVCPIYMEFCDDSEATFKRALDLLLVIFFEDVHNNLVVLDSNYLSRVTWLYLFELI